MGRKGRRPTHGHPSRAAAPCVVIPVEDATSSPPSLPSASSPSPGRGGPLRPHPSKGSSPQPSFKTPALDPDAAATKIQSCFRGSAVRSHKPLPNLRRIAAVQKQLDHLQAQMHNGGFLDRITSNEKERLRFIESIMALLFQLDAIEGSLPEIRWQRKEAARKAVGLQDAVDDMLKGRKGGMGGVLDQTTVGNESLADVSASLESASLESHKSKNASSNLKSRRISGFESPTDVNASSVKPRVLGASNL
ncbi:hypothetical protein L7F22_010119 [Adiantum nelumboides]|nr:hypothetical protein [Adiantum nelumboides]